MNDFLPASIRLPFGFVIHVKAVAPRTLRKVAQSDVMGAWDVSTRTIYIDRTMSEKEQRYVLTHEMIHAFVDWQHEALGGAEEPARVRRADVGTTGERRWGYCGSCAKRGWNVYDVNVWRCRRCGEAQPYEQ